MEDLDACIGEMSPITRRMYAMGIINDMNQITSQLIKIDERIDTSLRIEDACLDFSAIAEIHNTVTIKSLMDEKMYLENQTKDSDINKLPDSFPLDKDDYSFSSENADILKTGMRYLCSDANISPRDIVYALSKGIHDIVVLLSKIGQKQKSIKEYQWEDFWYEFLYRDDDLWSERAFGDYEQWKEEHDCTNIQVLRDKLTQEILNLLKSGVFDKDTIPTNRDMDNCVVSISKEALEEGTDVPDNIKKECARFSKYVTYKDDILCLDYAKLGRYVYKHYNEIEDDVLDKLIYFDYIILHIHDDMAECKPQLKKYLRFYEDDLLQSILEKATSIIDSCKGLLKEGVEEDFLKNYMNATFWGDVKDEVQSKLKGQSNITIICHMLGMLKTTLRVFKMETSSADLAQAMSSVIQKPSGDSLKRYIDKGASIRDTRLLQWTQTYVVEKLGSNKERLFYKIAKK